MTEDMQQSSSIDENHSDDELSSEEGRILHVHDLPQLYTKPTAATLLETLALCARSSSAFDGDRSQISQPQIDPSGLAGYLTGIVSSSLSWIEDEDVRERIWEAASVRLSERSGRNAAPSMTRSFTVNDHLSIRLYEPSLTEDNLGLKTWTSSLLLARRLESLHRYVPTGCFHVLELGSGTGLVGIAAACLWRTDVTLTDLPEIVPNLQVNIDANIELLDRHSSTGKPPVLTSRILDWSMTQPQPESSRFEVILAADPLYSPTHASILTETVQNYLAQTPTSCFILELPVRGGYVNERADLHRLLKERMAIIEEGTEIGFDDWEDSSGRPKQVECCWSVWRRK